MVVSDDQAVGVEFQRPVDHMAGAKLEPAGTAGADPFIMDDALVPVDEDGVEALLARALQFPDEVVLQMRIAGVDGFAPDAFRPSGEREFSRCQQGIGQFRPVGQRFAQGGGRGVEDIGNAPELRNQPRRFSLCLAAQDRLQELRQDRYVPKRLILRRCATSPHKRAMIWI